MGSIARMDPKLPLKSQDVSWPSPPTPNSKSFFQSLKSWKHDFEITGDPKGPPSGSNFWSGFGGPDS